MSCFFCESPYHLSHNCDVYDSIKSRKEFINSLNLCDACLLNTKHKKCIKKCYICFSNDHHTVFCPEKLSQFFLPKIDQMLWQRFCRTSFLDEQYAVAFTYPNAMKLEDIKPFVVRQYITNFDFDFFIGEHQDHNFVLAGTVAIYNNAGGHKRSLFNRNSTIFKIKSISMFFCYELSTELFLQMVSPFTKYLSFGSHLTSPIKFSKLLQRIPSIKTLKIYPQTNFTKISCFFCDSSFHLSHQCEDFDPIVLKKHFVNSKDFCPGCLSPSHSIYSRCQPMCYNCFSDEHHAIYCPKKSMFVPNIDRDLFPRFFKSLSVDEQYAMALSYPTVPKLKSMKPLVVMSIINYYQNVGRHQNCNIIANRSINITDEMQNQLLTLLNQKSLITKARNISFYIRQKLSSKLLFQLLSPLIKELSVEFVEFGSKIAFSEILQKCPNIERIHIIKCEIENSWPHDLQRYIVGSNFCFLKMTTSNLNFNIASLVYFMKTKMCKGRIISLFLPKLETTVNQLKFERKIANYFVQHNNPDKSTVKLRITYGNGFFEKSTVYVCS